MFVRGEDQRLVFVVVVFAVGTPATVGAVAERPAAHQPHAALGAPRISLRALLVIVRGVEVVDPLPDVPLHVE